MKEKLIGILAGMGPRSTAPFIEQVIDECQLQYGAKYDEEYPKMMIYSLPTPFYIDKPIDHGLMKKTIIEGLKRLEEIGVDFIAMPCNSAHIYYEELRDSINVKLLDIVEETINRVPFKSQRITMFSTSTTYNSLIYQKGIERSNHEFIFKDNWQLKINTLIQSIKLDKKNDKNIKVWNELLEDIRVEQIENVIVACTDLNAVLEHSKYPINIIDSSNSLAKAVVENYLKIV